MLDICKMAESMARWLPTGDQDALQIPAVQQLVAQPTHDTRQSRGSETRTFIIAMESSQKTICPASPQVIE